MTAYWKSFLLRLGMNAAVALCPVLIAAAERAQTDAQSAGKISIAMLVAALLIAVKQIQSHLDLRAPAKE